MRLLIVIICFLVLACKNGSERHKASQKAWTVASVDSFQLGKQKVFLKKLVNEKRDSFQILCDNGQSGYLSLTLEAPPGEVKAQDIAGDSLPEIIVDDCLGCDLGRLRLFYFDRAKQHYRELRGTDSLLSDIHKLDGTDLIYNVACFNQGGCESTLLKIVCDRCISLGSMYVPYGEEPIQLTNNLNRSTKELLPRPNDLDTDSLYIFCGKSIS